MSATAQIIGGTAGFVDTRDATGRELTLKQLTALDRLRLFKALGSTLSQNNAYLGMAMLAACVVAIDSVPVPPPVTEGQVEGLVGRLGDIGIAAVAAAISDLSQPDLENQTLGN